MKYLKFDKDGNLTARYDSEINGDKIPKGCVEVEDELFFKTINEIDGLWKFVGKDVKKTPLPEQNPNDKILNEITELESSITPRRIRESLLGDVEFVTGVNLKIEKLRAKLS